jgi:hypothetical protein
MKPNVEKISKTNNDAVKPNNELSNLKGCVFHIEIEFCEEDSVASSQNCLSALHGLYEGSNVQLKAICKDSRGEIFVDYSKFFYSFKCTLLNCNPVYFSDSALDVLTRFSSSIINRFTSFISKYCNQNQLKNFAIIKKSFTQCFFEKTPIISG